MKNFSRYKTIFTLFSLSVFFVLSCKEVAEPVVLENIQVSTKKSDFYFGEWLNRNDVQVMATFSNEDYRDVTEWAIFTPSLPTAVFEGRNEIEVSYCGEKKTLVIYGSSAGYDSIVQSISLELAEPNRTFYEGDRISKSDFIVKATYNDGHTKIVTENATFDGLGKLDAGYATITVKYENQEVSSGFFVQPKEYPPASIPNALYIVGSFSDWDFMPMEKDGDYFFYEFDESNESFEWMGTLEFKITTDAFWADGDNEVFAGSIVPSTGFYVAPTFYGIPRANAKITIAQQGDKIYIRYENGICYARYVAQGEYVSPYDEMEIVDALQIELGDFPEYVFADETVTIEVFKDVYIPCDYTYQWYRYEISDPEIKAVPVSNATSNTFQGFIEGDAYCFSVTATQCANPKNTITIKTPAFYVIDKDVITMSLSWGRNLTE